jgi:hypothetical protein
VFGGDHPETFCCDFAREYDLLEDTHDRASFMILEANEKRFIYDVTR